MTHRPLRRTALSLLAAATLAACGGTPTDTAEPAPTPPDGTTAAASDAATRPDGTPPATSADGPSTAANAPALAFSGVDLDGAPVTGETFAGGDVVLWMWAPW